MPRCLGGRPLPGKQGTEKDRLSSDYLRTPITAADLVIEVDGIGGGEALDHFLAHMAPAGIGEDAEQPRFSPGRASAM